MTASTNHDEIQVIDLTAETHASEAPPNPTTQTSLPAINSGSIPSPIHLNFVHELPQESNVDTVSLGSILGDVMIRECWLFNYLFDVDFIM